MIDAVAQEIVVNRYGLAADLHVPIAAVDEAAIGAYVGQVQRVLSGRSSRRALLVLAKPPPDPDLRLPIWQLASSDMLHRPLQVWVDQSYTPYRKAYRRAFPDENLDDLVLSHTMNRRVAALKGFQFVRITPTSRAANSSSAFSENWGAALHGDPVQMATNRRRGAFIQYADLSELMLMLDFNLGGGPMDAVNAGQRLIRPALPDESREGSTCGTLGIPLDGPKVT